MTPERVPDHPALLLDQRARERYFSSAQAQLSQAEWVDEAGARPSP